MNSTEKKCLICDSISFNPIYNNTLVQCTKCKFVTANMMVDANLLKEIYSENYFKGEEYSNYLMDKEILQINFKKRLDAILKLIPKHEITNVLEVGCAYGFFSEVLTNRINSVSYIGYDIVEEAIKYGQEELKQNLICDDYLQTKTEKKYSDVFMWDVIEHLPNPELFIEKISSETQKGGRLYITTGDIERFVPKFKKEKWRMIHPPSHLHYFSKSTITKLLLKNGFKVIDVSYPSVYRSLRLIFFSLFILKKKPSNIVDKIYNNINPKLNIPINTYDIMFVTAERQ